MIYFLQNKYRLVKIGFTENFDTRIVTLKREHGELKLLGVLNGNFREEQRLHADFANDRLVKEWFVPSQAILKFIKLNTVSSPDDIGKATYKVKIDHPFYADEPPSPAKEYKKPMSDLELRYPHRIRADIYIYIELKNGDYGEHFLTSGLDHTYMFSGVFFTVFNGAARMSYFRSDIISIQIQPIAEGDEMGITHIHQRWNRAVT